MANGKLAASTPSINTDTLLYQCPAGKTASVSITVCNTNTTTTEFRISVEDSGASSISTSNCIEYDISLNPISTFERGGVVLGSEQKLFCRSSSSSVNFIVLGYEE